MWCINFLEKDKQFLKLQDFQGFFNEFSLESKWILSTMYEVFREAYVYHKK